MKNKNTIINSTIFILLIIITYIIIFKNSNLLNIYNQISKLNIIYILLAILTMFLYFLIESINIKNILTFLKEKISLKNALKYTFIGYFFSSITPASTGGQPMEIYYMSKDKIKISNATIAILIYLSGHHIASVTIGIISIILNPNILNSNLLIIFIIGNLLNTIPIILTLIGIFKENIVTKLSNIIVKLLNFIKYKNKDNLIKKLDIELKNYTKSAKFIKENKHQFFKAILISFIHVTVYYSVPYFIYKAFNLNNFSILKFIELQSILHSTVCSIPLPGSVGANEAVFLLVYNKIYNKSLLESAMLINRFISFYLFVIISLSIVIINKIKFKKRNIIRKNQQN